jgi:hypothetical protein
MSASLFISPFFFLQSDKRLAAATPAQVMFGTEEPAFAVYARDGRQCIIEKAAKGIDLFLDISLCLSLSDLCFLVTTFLQECESWT